MQNRQTVVFDFDGVIHSYRSGWKGATIIPDPVVPGIADVIKELMDLGYWVVVVSTRCSAPGGTEAVMKYLDDNSIEVHDVLADKPPAICYIDDRAIRFNGRTEGLVDEIKSFTTWLDETDMNPPVKGLRPCNAKVYKDGKYQNVFGWFHRWSESYEEFETGPGNFPVAIIELHDGQTVLCPAENVKFR